MPLPPEDPPPPPPPITVGPTTFDLEASPGALRAAADGWRALAAGARRTFETVDPPAARLRETWEGRAGDGYDDHRRRLDDDLLALADAADRAGGVLDDIAGSLATGQDDLDRLLASAPCRVSGRFTFHPADEADVAAVGVLVDAARAVRVRVDGQVATDGARLETCRSDLDGVAARWYPGAAPYRVPAESGRGIRTLMTPDGVVLDTGGGHDRIEIGVDPDSGLLVVVVNGERRVFAAGTPLVLRSGSGADTVRADELADGFTLLAGDDNDLVRGGLGADVLVGGAGDDVLEAGAGDDRLSGGRGTDYLDGADGADHLAGGAGGDMVYGGLGDDLVGGGTGDDYLEAGRGDDRVAGGAGDDVVSGGRDDDALAGGAGDDVAYAGMGDDHVTGGTGMDTAYVEDGVDTAEETGTQYVSIDPELGEAYVNVSGSDEFQARIAADMDLFRASPTGQEMLRSLDEVHEDTKAIAADWPILGGPAYGGDVVTVHEFDEPNGRASPGIVPSFIALDLDIHINPEFIGPVDGPPSTVLFHELAHTWDYSHGTFRSDAYEGVDPVDFDPMYERTIKEGERQATGLPIDHDDDPDTPEIVDPDHPLVYTENGLRAEMGLPRRDHYRGG